MWLLRFAYIIFTHLLANINEGLKVDNVDWIVEQAKKVLNK